MWRPISYIAAVGGVNCYTNSALSQNVEFSFVVYHRHRFYLAVSGFLNNYMEIIEKIHAIVSELSNQIPAAKLHMVSKLKPKTNKTTLWSPTLFVIERQREIHPFYDTSNLKDISGLLLTAREGTDVDALYL